MDIFVPHSTQIYTGGYPMQSRSKGPLQEWRMLRSLCAHVVQRPARPQYFLQNITWGRCIDVGLEALYCARGVA
jgi:hypothetical protein